MPLPSARLAVVFALGLVVGACGESADPLVGAWAGSNASGPATLVFRADRTYELVITHPDGRDSASRVQRETGTWARGDDGVLLRVANSEVLEPAPGKGDWTYGDDPCYRFRAEGDSAVLEESLWTQGNPSEPNADWENVWGFLARLQRDDG